MEVKEIRIFPNSQKLEFKSKDELNNYIREDLRTSKRKGRYNFRRFRSVKLISPGSIALFRFADAILGWGAVREKAVYEPFDDEESEQHYEGYIMFRPETVKAFKKPLSVKDLEAITGMVFHYKDNFNTGRSYYKIPFKFRNRIKEWVESIEGV